MNDNGGNAPDIDEGYVKYDSNWTHGSPPDSACTDLLNRWRKPLFDAGLIGHYESLGVGYGNISVRTATEQFVISGTQTGHIDRTNAEHYVLVTQADVELNRVDCLGPIQASSEALTHAALYALGPRVNAVVHVHDAALWGQFKGKLPTTASDVAYGTPAMAREFERLWKQTEFPECGVAVMAGHAEGLVSIGENLAEAATRILELRAQV